MSKFEGNPFGWGFEEQRYVETLPTRAKAKYSKPQETADEGKADKSYFEEFFGVSPNVAHVVAWNEIKPHPYLMDEDSSEDSGETESTEGSEG